MRNIVKKPSVKKPNLKSVFEQIHCSLPHFKSTVIPHIQYLFVILLCESRQLEVPFCYICYLPAWREAVGDGCCPAITSCLSELHWMEMNHSATAINTDTGLPAAFDCGLFEGTWRVNAFHTWWPKERWGKVIPFLWQLISWTPQESTHRSHSNTTFTNSRQKAE